MIPVLAFVALVVAFALGYLLGRARRASPGDGVDATTVPSHDVGNATIVADHTPVSAAPTAPEPAAVAAPPLAIADDQATHRADDPAIAAAANAERARVIRGFEAEAAALRHAVAADRAEIARLAALASERARLDTDLAAARADAARYRQFVVDLENNALPPLLGGPGAPDDLKLIVGIGPVLERMLYQLGITAYRQIGRWNERDIDEIDAKLPEFPGRIRRDGWVTQARALHQSKYGAALPPRDRS